MALFYPITNPGLRGLQAGPGERLKPADEAMGGIKNRDAKRAANKVFSVSCCSC